MSTSSDDRPPDASELDVNDIVLRLRTLAPPERWMMLNSRFFGPHFSVCDQIDVPFDVLVSILSGKPDWLRSVGIGTKKKWLFRPHNKPIQIRALLDSLPDGDYPIWLWVSRDGVEPRIGVRDMIPRGDVLERGWEQLGIAERKYVSSLVEKNERGLYGRLPPSTGWPTTSLSVSRGRPTRRDGRPSQRLRSSGDAEPDRRRGREGSGDVRRDDARGATSEPPTRRRGHGRTVHFVPQARSPAARSPRITRARMRDAVAAATGGTSPSSPPSKRPRSQPPSPRPPRTGNAASRRRTHSESPGTASRSPRAAPSPSQQPPPRRRHRQGSPAPPGELMRGDATPHSS